MPLRGAYDIGSGATKLQIAEVEDGRIKESKFAKEIIVTFSWDSEHNPDRVLSEGIQEQGLAALRELHAEAVKLGVTEVVAICTAIFRLAPNGADYREKARQIIGTEARLLTQTEEALVGYRTAQALSTCPVDQLISWDSGGGSFQICRLKTGIPAASTSADLDTYLGQLGGGVCTAMYQARIGRGQGVSPNPVSPEQAEIFTNMLMDSHLPEPPSWLLEQDCIWAIGGPTSVFRQCLEILNEQGPDFRAFNLSDVECALSRVVNKTDEELALYAETQMVAVKMCLLLAVMRKCRFKEVKHVCAIGSCPGVLVSDGWYERQ